MGINSTDTAYAFGQLGSGFVDDGGAFTQLNDVGFFSHTAIVAAAHGTNAEPTDASQIFPKGLTIYGRWTAVTAAADADGGIICYFGE